MCLLYFAKLYVAADRDWPGIKDMPEWHSMKRLDHKHNQLPNWCSKTSFGYGLDFLRQTFAWDPDKRATAREALQHKWFQDEPRPTAK